MENVESCCRMVGKMRNDEKCSMSVIVCPWAHSLFIWMGSCCTLAVRPSCPVFSVGQLCYYLCKVHDGKTSDKKFYM